LKVVRELKWNADDADGLVVRCSLIVVREVKLNADDTDCKDLHSETLWNTVILFQLIVIEPGTPQSRAGSLSIIPALRDRLFIL